MSFQVASEVNLGSMLPQMFALFSLLLWRLCGVVERWDCVGVLEHGGVPEGQAASALASGQVRDIFSSEFTFTALLNDGSIVSWEEITRVVI